MHRAHQDLPVECSQLTHALPELMNQAATNYKQVNTSFGVTATDARVKHVDSVLLQQLNVHSSNPAVNVVITGDVTNNILEAEKVKQNYLREQCDSKHIESVNPSERVSKTVNSLPRGISCNNIFTKAIPNPTPMNPFSIPTTTSITTAATATITQPQRRARASLAIRWVQLEPPLPLGELSSSLPCHQVGSARASLAIRWLQLEPPLPSGAIK